MWNRVFLLFLACAGLFLPVAAQKKEIAQARAYVKADNNLEKAEEMMDRLLTDSANRRNEKIWLVLFGAVKRQYEQGNEQLYLRQAYDTARLFTATLKMFQVLESLDSLDAQPDARGQVKLQYRKRHAEQLASYRPNLYHGGNFHLRKHEWGQAYRLFDAYLDCARQPLFSQYDYAQTDTLLPHAAHLALFCGYQEGNMDHALRYADLARKDTARLDYVLQCLASVYKAMGDTARYVSILQRGFAHNPRFLFFFPRLVDHYAADGQWDEALALCDQALLADSASVVFRYAKSNVLLNTGQYEDCIALCDQLIAEDGHMAAAYYNAGLAYYDMAVTQDGVLRRDKKHRNRVNALYRKALPYLQRYRELAPGEQGKWASPLNTIYLNLNMGKEFEEIEKLMQDGKK